MTTITQNEIPIAKGKPIIGNALELLKNPIEFLLEEYNRSGPVFRVKAPGTNAIIMAGADANRFMQMQGAEYFSTAEAWQVFKEELNADKFILASDGEEHFELRRIMKRGYSPLIVKEKIPEIIKNIYLLATKEGIEKKVYTVDFMQRVVTNQLGFFLANTYPEHYFTDLRYFVRKLINVVVGRQPKVITSFPKYKKAKERSFELAKKVLQQHREQKNEVPDFIDDLLAANKDNIPYLSENDLINAAISPFIAGLDTVANTAAFQMYDLLKHPEILEVVRNEVNTVFSEGVPDINKLRRIKSLHALALESLRIHPSAPALKRVVKKNFEFQGYTIEKGETVMIPMVLTHFLPEFFPDPYKFDIDRYSRERNEHRQASIYAPFGLGPHICSGNKFAEVLLMAIAATMVHYFEFEPIDPNYKVKLDTDPIPGPSRKFYFKIKGIRNVSI